MKHKIAKSLYLIFLLFSAQLLLYFRASSKTNVDSLLGLTSEKQGKELASLYFEIGKFYNNNNISDSAFEYFFLAHVLAEETGDTITRCESANQLGLIYFYRKKFEKAIPYFIISEKLFKVKKNYKRSTRARIGIGNCYYGAGKPDTALQIYQSCIKDLYKQNDTLNLSGCFNNIARIYESRKEYEKAIEYHKKVLEIGRSGYDLPYLHPLISIGLIYCKKNEPAKALTAYREALSESISLHDSITIISIYIELASLYETNGSYNTALAMLDSALYFDKANKKTPVICQQKGNIYRKTGNNEKAITYYKNSIRTSHDNDYLVLENLKDIAEVLNELGNFREALEYFKKYHNTYDSVIMKENISRQKLDELAAVKEFNALVSKSEKTLTLVEKENQLKQAQINREKFFRNVSIAGASLILIIGILLFLILRYRFLRKKSEIENKLNMYMQKSLSQQMNPHFIFNTLNSIQYYINNNDKEASAKYLGIFSRLMRRTLDNSQNEFVKIKDELEAVNLYIELEKLRFGDKFEYIFNIENEDSIYDAEIPALILQPFIENAIWHGLLTLEKKGKLILHITQNNSKIKFSIEDNGIGRQKAQKLQENKNHISLGTKMIKSRIELYNEKRKDKILLNIIDKTDKEGNAEGTKIEILIPCISV
ncbi:MAG: tetratricopeptide repeat protein [Bacteroidia bacterium]|nr:tetratricopeptide repeat protein [Bacteroidia bacterium]